ncbi:MAG TPA: hypothetical protein VLB80_00905 [Candidatus Babeliales bacterium]|nr:hypothetical protein [Candidatus Babeliales bacterium]
MESALDLQSIIQMPLVITSNVQWNKNGNAVNGQAERLMDIKISP